MEALLSECTISEQRAVITFLWAEGIKPSEIHKRMLVQYGDKCTGQRKFYEWVERFKNGRTTVTGEDQSGRPITSSSVTNVDCVNTLVQENRQITVSAVANVLDIKYGSTYSVLHDELKYRKVCSRWVPKQLTEDHKQKHVGICTQFLHQYEREGEDLLERIVMEDETWVHRFETKSKQQSMQCKHTSSPPTKKFKNVPSAKKVMLILFWDISGPILEHYMEHGQTVNSERYSAMFKDKLKPAIRSKWRGLLSKTVLLHHDNVQPPA
jgi:transposase